MPGSPPRSSAFLANQKQKDGANPQLSQGYSTLIEQEIRRLL